jgi:hypothetical protein
MTIMRHKRSRPCPVCGGGEDMQRGQEKRCHGWTSDDGEYVHCSREELAGDIEADANGQTYPHRMHGPCRCGSTHGEARPRDTDIEVTYDYRDERGNLLFQVVRKTGKRFRQRRPDGDGWIWQLDQVRRVPYRLAQLVAADPSAPVYIAEGEKDVEALVVAGHVATTNPGGAGKWPAVAEVARPVLAGRDVVIVADNDEPGKKHAHEVAESVRPVARSVVLVAAPAPHKDVADLLAAGGAVADLVPMERPPLSPDWNLLDVSELARALPPVPWICEPLGLAPGAISLVAGYGYSRKTMALQSLGLSVAAGKQVWGLYSARRGPFVHLDYEQGRRLTQERYQRLARGMGFELADLEPGTLRVGCMPRIYLDEKQTFDDLVRLVEGAAFVLVDSLRAAFPHADENSSEVRSYLDVLSRVSERTGAAFAVIHHARKPQQGNDTGATFAIRGSSALFDACQSVYVFIGEKNTPTTVHHQKDRIRGACLDDFGLDGEDVPNGSDPRWGLRVVHLEASQVREADAVERAKGAVLKAIGKSRSGYYSANEVADALDIRKGTVLAAVRALMREGILTQAGSDSPFRIGSREAS